MTILEHSLIIKKSKLHSMHYLLKHNMLTDSVKRITEEIGIIKNYYRSLNFLCRGQRYILFIVRYVHFKYLQIENSMIRDLNSVRLVTQYID